MPQYKVPQHIDMKDKIVGPLTMFQFLYLLAGGMVFYGTLKTPGAIDLVLIGIPAGLIAMAFAFVKINDQPFGRFVSSFIAFVVNPKTRVWHHGGESPKINVTQNLTAKKQVVRKDLDRDRLKQFISKVDN